MNTFMGHELDDDGTVKGAYPTFQTKISDVMKQINDNTESFIINQCVKFDIDPDVLKKQSVEIIRLREENKALRTECEELQKKWLSSEYEKSVLVKQVETLKGGKND